MRPLVTKALLRSSVIARLLPISRCTRHEAGRGVPVGVGNVVAKRIPAALWRFRTLAEGKNLRLSLGLGLSLGLCDPAFA
jgi:hypothetical protein